MNEQSPNIHDIELKINANTISVQMNGYWMHRPRIYHLINRF